MKPVFQTIFGRGSDEDVDDPSRGDCLRACVASIFELPIEQVPHFVAYADWWNRYVAWLRERNIHVEHRSCTRWRPVFDDDGKEIGKSREFPAPWGCIGIGSVRSPGFPGATHAVVVRGDEVIHDPNPAYEGHVYSHDEFVGFDSFIVIDPAKQKGANNDRSTASPREEEGRPRG